MTRTILKRSLSCRKPSRYRPGFTLAELLVAVGTTSVLMAGLMSCILIAGRALDEDRIVSAKQLQAGETLDQVLGDLHDAMSFSERTANAVTFQVPDRTGDELPETIRYSWSGIAGDPLRKEYNGSAPETLVTDVNQFDLIYSLRIMTGTGFAKGVILPEGNALLFVSGGFLIEEFPSGELMVAPTAQESARIALIESWGYAVEVIHCSQSQADFDSAVENANVAYISQEALQVDLGIKLVNTTIGVVNENCDMIDEFGFAAGRSMDGGLPTLNVDMGYYITSVFAANPVSPYVANEWYQIVNEPVAADVHPVGTWVEAPWTGKPALMALCQGDQLIDGGSAAGPRVQIPWGSGQGATPVALNSLSDDAKTIMQRAIEWAADPSLDGLTEIFVNDITMGWRKQGNSYYGQATVEVREDGGSGVAGALVRGEWSGAVSCIDLGTTGSDGTVMLDSPGNRDGGTYTFTVTDITLGGYAYNPALNLETSDSITVP